MQSLKRALMNQRILPRELEFGKVYTFQWEPKHEISDLDKFPLVYPLKLAPGQFEGINLTILPRRDIRQAVIEEIKSIQEIKSANGRRVMSERFLRKCYGNNLMRHAVHAYKFPDIKSKIAEVDEETVKNLVRRSL